MTVHADICSANRYSNLTEDGEHHVYGWAYCTCGADIAGVPIYEVEEAQR